MESKLKKYHCGILFGYAFIFACAICAGIAQFMMQPGPQQDIHLAMKSAEKAILIARTE